MGLRHAANKGVSRRAFAGFLSRGRKRDPHKDEGFGGKSRRTLLLLPRAVPRQGGAFLAAGTQVVHCAAMSSTRCSRGGVLSPAVGGRWPCLKELKNLAR